MKFTRIFLTALCFYTIAGQAQELPINPWAQQKHYVKTSNGADNTESSAAPQANTVQVPLWAEKRAQQIEENNARRREAMIARQKAEQERRRQQAEAEAAAAQSNDGMLEKISNFFSDSSKPAAQPAPVASSNDIDWQKEYDSIFQKTPLSSQSLRKLKNSYNRIKNINVDKMINDTMNDLQK